MPEPTVVTPVYVLVASRLNVPGLALVLGPVPAVVSAVAGVAGPMGTPIVVKVLLFAWRIPSGLAALPRTSEPDALVDSVLVSPLATAIAPEVIVSGFEIDSTAWPL